MLFKDRKDAGDQLAVKLTKFFKLKDTVILALPRGGVVVAKEISKALNLPLDIIVPRKIGAPYNNELAIGAICEGVIFVNTELVSLLQIDESYIKNTVEIEKKESIRRKLTYRKGKKELHLENKNVIIVDDGIATGATVIASIKYLKTKKTNRIILAVPVAPADIIPELESICDEVICLYAPSSFMAIGQFYENFPQTSDEEVISLLQ